MTGAISAVAWGLFCACSWTWCIGMFLPKIMVERYGALGFVVFAVPNVIGCALMGYIVSSAASSRAMVERHAPAMAAFSLVTIAFHMFFVGWVFETLVPIPHVPSVAIAAAVLGVGMIAGRLGNVSWIAITLLVYALSVFAFATLLAGGEIVLVVDEPTRAASDALWLSPVIVAGFLCSPYLDATFHRARQCATTPHAFSVFGLAFGAMIVMTLFVWLRGDAPLPALALAHLLAQTTFTVGAHVRELRSLRPMRCPIRRSTWMFAALAPAIVVPVGSLLIDDAQFGPDMYLRFLVAYGLLAPAYVLVFIGPRRGVHLSRRALVPWAIVVVGLVPIYEAAFIGRAAWLMVVPGVLAAAWLVVPRARA